MRHIIAALALLVPTLAAAQGNLVLYCAPQEEWCRAMVTAFERKTGVKVAMTRKSSGELYRARLGRGAFLNERAMRVTDADTKQAVVELGWSSRRPVRAYTSLVERVLATGATFLRAGSGALGLAYVAAGRTHGYCELHINSWDTLAGLLMVREAGGWTNDFLAGDGLRRGNAVLACAPGLKDALVTATGVGQANEKLERRIS